MNNTKKSLKVLFIGESWHIHMIHSKGYDSFTSSKYEEGATWLLQCLKNSQVDVTYMPAHTVQIAFPEDVAQIHVQACRKHCLSPPPGMQRRWHNTVLIPVIFLSQVLMPERR